MRLDKYLSEMGVGTRSEIKKACKAGHVRVDGAVIKDSGLKIDENKVTVTYNGLPVTYEAYVYFMLNKPAGVISASDDPRHETVIDLIDEQKRKDLFPVGRLDRDTEGLLLITNDGELAHRLLAPKHHVDKVYYAEIAGVADESDIKAFADGLTLDGGLECMPADLQILETDPEYTYEEFMEVSKEELDPADPDGEVAEAITGSSRILITIREGKFHQVKRMFEAVGKKVMYLQRLSMGPLELDDTLEPGEYRRLTESELAALKAL